MRKIMFILALASFAAAQEPNPPGTEPVGQRPADPPGRAARLSYLNGTVSFQPGGVDDWVPAELNRPMTTGDRIWADDGARAEMNLGSAAFRINSRTNFTFLNLDDRTTQVQLSLGTLNVRLRHLDPDETMEIDTPQVAFTLLRPGDYRVEVNDTGDATMVTVRGGDGEVNANGQVMPVRAREQLRIRAAEGSEPVFDQRPAPPADPFDIFCQDRDRHDDLSPSTKYVSRDTPGYGDLDANGTWRNDPVYGPVWVPSNVPADWVPYHYGHWAYIAPWGWTWIDEAPWGYAPFHYGRWAVVAGTWVWIPGPLGPPPVYAPAMVVFVGGAGFGVGVVGWFPLGPHEVFMPTYGVSVAYVTRINVTNTVVAEVAVRDVYARGGVGAVYANRAVPGAVMAVRGDAFAGGRRINAAVAVHVPSGAIERAEVMRFSPAAPQRAAMLGGRTPLATHLPPPASMNRPMMARTRAVTPMNRSNVAPAARPEAPAPRAAPPASKRTSKPSKKTTRSEKDR